MRQTLIGLSLLFLAMTAGNATAHPLAPAMLELTQQSETEWNVLWRMSTRSTTLRPLVPIFPDHCETSAVKSQATGPIQLTRTATLHCPPPGLANQQIRIAELERSPINVVLRITDLGGNSRQVLLDSAEPSYQVASVPSSFETFQQFLLEGIRHMAGGPDHLLFLLALLILASGWRQLLWIITAFTAGHSLTLGLSVTAIISVPAPLAEFLIAVTLVVTARELMCKRPTLFSRHLGLFALLFGLIHGLGFAESLLDLGIPRDALLPALAGFNIGIEVAQIVIAVLFTGLLHGLNRMQLTGPSGSLRVLPAYLIGSVAVLWCLERLILMREAASTLGV